MPPSCPRNESRTAASGNSSSGSRDMRVKLNSTEVTVVVDAVCQYEIAVDECGNRRKQVFCVHVQSVDAHLVGPHELHELLPDWLERRCNAARQAPHLQTSNSLTDESPRSHFYSSYVNADNCDYVKLSV